MTKYRSIQNRILSLLPCKLERFKQNSNLKFTELNTIKYVLDILIEQGKVRKTYEGIYKSN